MGEGIEAVRVHAAASSPSADTDADGLPDELELKLGTSVDRFDTDYDGYSDGEEVARGSYPTRYQSVPEAGDVGLEISAYQSGDRIHALTAIYFADGDLRSRHFTVGILVGNTLTPKPLHLFRGDDPIRLIPGNRPGSTVALVNPVIPAGMIQLLGSLSFYATISGQGQYAAADALNLVLIDGVICEHVIVGYHGGGPVQDPFVGMGVGGVYQPLGSGGGPPPHNSTQGEICAQTTVVVGVVGAVVTQEVMHAACVPGWDAQCSSKCGQTVGSTIRIIDPGTLVGG